MTRTAGRALAVAVLLAGVAMPALAAVEREDIIMLGRDGRHYTSYKTLRSDLSERVLYLAPQESANEALFIVPSDYQRSELADGGSRLRFHSGSYAIMNAGHFDDEIQRADNGDFIFTSWDGRTRADGHLGKWNSPDDFASFAYSWVMPANIEIVSYKANRNGQWQRRENTLSWHGEQVNDIAFTIRYHVADADSHTHSATAEAPTPPSAPPEPVRPENSRPAPAEHAPPALPSSTRPRMADVELATEPSASIETLAAPATQTPAEPAQTSGPQSVTLDSVVALANGRPRVTARGHAVLDRLAQSLVAGNAQQITVTGPQIADSRDTGGSVAQAARVADYLGSHGLEGEQIAIRAGRVVDGSENRSIEVKASPGSALAGFSARD